SVAITIDTTVASQDQTTGRANTLLDDADDIQKQLDNEVRDRLKYRPITGWVLSTPIHYPTSHPQSGLVKQMINIRGQRNIRCVVDFPNHQSIFHTTA
ncbi:unnamed protein product, partial [Leptidea sinapis]